MRSDARQRFLAKEKGTKGSTLCLRGKFVSQFQKLIRIGHGKFGKPFSYVPIIPRKKLTCMPGTIVGEVQMPCDNFPGEPDSLSLSSDDENAAKTMTISVNNFLFDAAAGRWGSCPHEFAPPPTNILDHLELCGDGQSPGNRARTSPIMLVVVGVLLIMRADAAAVWSNSASPFEIEGICFGYRDRLKQL